MKIMMYKGEKESFWRNSETFSKNLKSNKKNIFQPWLCKS